MDSERHSQPLAVRHPLVDKQTGHAWRWVAAGVASAAALFAVASVLSAFFGPMSSPLAAVGATFIDFTPPWLKDFAIATFGTQDKFVLLMAMALVATVAAAAVGLIARRSQRAADAVVVLIAAIMAACILSRSGTRTVDLIPLALGTVTGLWVLHMLASAAQPWQEAPSGPSRRAFLARLGTVAGAAVVLAWGGTLLNKARNTVTEVRAALHLPAPSTPAPQLPAGVQAPVAGVGPFITPNQDFYRIDTALVPPRVDPADWQLRVHGMVEEEFTLSFAQLLASELVESYVTLACVSNEVGGNLAGNAKWLGLPLRELMARAKPLPGADMVLSTSADGFTASTPLPVLQDGRDALLAVGMNGEPLPVEHGFPVRMVVPGLYGFVSATKWVVDLEVTTFAVKAYWTTRGWSSHGPIKTASRIEVPRDGARVPAENLVLGGTAWAQTRGISQVEVQFDGGSWHRAQLADEASVDTWRQWSFVWDGARPGAHTVRVRAYDGSGALQLATDAPPAPDGATGWHSVNFTVA